MSKIKNQNIITYGLHEKSNFKIKNISLQTKYSKFDIEINLPNQTKKVIKSFQQHYLPKNVTGKIDRKTLEISHFLTN